MKITNVRSGSGLQELATVVAALQTLGGAQEARVQLAGVCARHNVQDVIGLPAPSSLPQAQERAPVSAGERAHARRP